MEKDEIGIKNSEIFDEEAYIEWAQYSMRLADTLVHLRNYPSGDYPIILADLLRRYKS